MTSKQNDIKINFISDKNDIPKEIKKTQGAVGSLIPSIDKSLLAFGGFAAAAIPIGLATAGVAKLGKELFSVSSQIDTAMSDMSRSMGQPLEVIGRLEKAVTDVFKNNVHLTLEESGQLVTKITKSFEGLSKSSAHVAELATEASNLSKVFDVDVDKVIQAASSLTDRFGISADETFDLMAVGFQKNLNEADDLLDTINEYSTQFVESGATAKQFFSLMESGMQGGMLGTDRAADAFKEFRVRILDGSEATDDALKDLFGGSQEEADKFLKSIRSGQFSVADAFSFTISKLGELEDPMKRMQTGVGLLGTQFEDLGDTVALGLTLDSNSFSNVENAADSLGKKYTSLGDIVENVKRRLALLLEPLTGKIVEFFNKHSPKLDTFFNNLETKIAPLVETWATNIGQYLESIDWKKFLDTVTGFFNGISQQDWAGVAKNIGAFATLITGLLTELLAAPEDRDGLNFFRSIRDFIDEVFNESGDWDNWLESFMAAVNVIYEFHNWLVNPTSFDISNLVNNIDILGSALFGSEDAWTTFKDWITSTINAIALVDNTIASTFEGVKTDLTSWAKWLIDWMSKAWNAITDFWNADDTEEAVSDGGEGLFKGLASFNLPFINQINAFIQNISDNLLGFWDAFTFQNIVTAALAAFEVAVLTFSPTFKTSVGTFVDDIADVLLGFWNPNVFMSAVLTGLNGFLPAISTFYAIGSAFINALTSANTSTWDLLSESWKYSKINTLVSEGLPGLTDGLSTFQSTSTFLGDLLKFGDNISALISSPWLPTDINTLVKLGLQELVNGMGTFINTSGYFQLLDNKMGDISASLAGAWATEDIKGFVSSGLAEIKNSFNSWKDTTSLFSDLANFGADLYNKITENFNPSRLFDLGNDAMADLASGLSGKFQGILNDMGRFSTDLYNKIANILGNFNIWDFIGLSSNNAPANLPPPNPGTGGGGGGGSLTPQGVSGNIIYVTMPNGTDANSFLSNLSNVVATQQNVAIGANI